MKSIARKCAVCFLWSLGACGPNEMAPVVDGTVEQAIIGGTLDTGDPSVVMVIALPNDGSGGAICSGSVVSPHVVATAGHCVDPTVLNKALGGKPYTLLVFTGSDNNDPAQYNDTRLFFGVLETAADPGYMIVDAGYSVHDVGALVTHSALALTPIPINRHALNHSDIGTSVHIVGYGRTDASTASSGVRHDAWTKLASVDSEKLSVVGLPSTCEGDSGGPTLLPRNGVESIVGVHAYGNSVTCDHGSFDMRGDVELAPFIDPIIAAHDPGFEPPSDGVPVADAGTDAGVDTPDAGVSDVPDAGTASPTPRPGCSAAPSGLASLIGLVVVAGVRRRKSLCRAGRRRLE
jgi:uncharacterized protein (TIGR03382 family)